MEIQVTQLIMIGVYLALAVSFYYLTNKYMRGLVIAITLLLFFANPFRMTATSIKQVERGAKKFDDIPKRVIVEQRSFDDFNKSEIDKLDELYEETKDEIHN